MSFSVFGSGTITGYQWYRNGSVIAGATSNMYDFATTVSNNGDKYKVETLGPCGNVMSAEVVLTVTSVPTSPTECVRASKRY
ncbi:MAG: hypothetical protein EAZ32_10335 [Cytophagia bacterium]|nr:MAG: hypothetical protein EAZ46_05910 [Runella sp.]TAG20239.1 MAG: hypothetical protein EAZ38_10885 [Cytophagales bacterium]TAG39358.1 MAG: hypothetical protein EAZ32_10335 [Cytophagia bacterium]TAG81052.1 MAG: hypothetical protein EAZ22_08225 [Cytophagales bacterium]